MAASFSKTIGLILLIAFLVLVGWRMTPLVMAPFGAFTGIFQSFKMNFSSLHLKPWGMHWSMTSLFSVLLFFIWLAIIVWVYRDAERRGMNGVLWALLVLIGNLIGLLIYLIVRTDVLPSSPADRTESLRPCPHCGKDMALNHTFCPHCGKPREKTCPACGKHVESEWKLCPHCGEQLG